MTATIATAAAERSADIVVVGGGMAGLASALGALPLRVRLLTKASLAKGAASLWAQGGIAAAIGKDDEPALHAADTVAAGAGLVDRAVAQLLTEEAPAVVRRLIALGAEFDRTPEGEPALGREGAHSRRRILHAHGDSTGAELVRVLAEAARREPRIEIREHVFAEELALVDGRVVGVWGRHADGSCELHRARAVVLATGGAGRLYRATTNPREATADGLAMAARAGAALIDLEFVQFHPTALAVDTDPLPLLSEALRGEGAILVDERGERFLAAEHPLAELAPRDIVARAIWRRLASGGSIFLDARPALGERFPERFPGVFALCQEHGLDPRREALPVTPAAHFHMGGIEVDLAGRSSLPGLWACGEVAATGVHGANRLASNSLLEALVFGARVAADLRGELSGIGDETIVPSAAPRDDVAGVVHRGPSGGSVQQLDRQRISAVEAECRLRERMWLDVGLVRERTGLERALAEIETLLTELEGGASEARNLLTAGWLVARAAWEREESRGAHFRADFPAPDPAWLVRLELAPDFSGAAPDAKIRRRPLPATDVNAPVAR